MIKTIRLLIPLALVTAPLASISDPFSRKEEIFDLTAQILEKKSELHAAQFAAYQDAAVTKLLATPVGSLFIAAKDIGLTSTIHLTAYVYAKKLDIMAEELIMKLRKQFTGDALQKHQADAEETLNHCNHLLCDAKIMAKVTAALWGTYIIASCERLYEEFKTTAPLRAEIEELKRQRNILLMIR